MALDPITAAFDLGGKILDKIFPDPAQRAQAQIKLSELQQSGELAKLTAETDLAKGQLEINKIDAANNSLFVSGWRPAVGWTCAGGFMYQLLFRPILGWLAQNILGWSLPPSLEVETLMTVLFGLLGLGGYRTYEKIRGVAK